MTQYLGLDVHSKTTSFCLMDQGAAVLAEGEIPTSTDAFRRLFEELRLGEDTLAGLESGTQAEWCSHVLSAGGLVPHVIDAREVRQLARRRGQKCDRRDAFEIADGMRRGIFTRFVWLPPAPIRRLRDILSRRRHFVRLRTMQVNAAKYLLRARALRASRLLLRTESAWLRLLARPEVSPLREHLRLHLEVWLVAHRHVTALEKELTEALEPYRETEQLLRTMPGVGLITAATFIAVVGTPRRFATSHHLASYAGLVPSTYDSGGRERRGSITKSGSPALREVLCEAAHSARHVRNPLNPYLKSVTARRGHAKAIVAVAHRMARILFQMWRKNERFDASKLNVVWEPGLVEKKVYYRLNTTKEVLTA